MVYVKEPTKQLVQDLASVPVYHKSAGIDSYPGSEEVARLLSRERRKPPVAGSLPAETGRVTGQSRPTGPGEIKKKSLVRAASVSEGGFKELADEITRCQACSLHQNRILPVPGLGSAKCTLLIVGDWLTADQAERFPDGCQFGIEQDRMLGRMLEAIKMDRSQVFVTNVIKCGIPSSTQPLAEHVNTCISFLHRQIRMLKPQLILAMGLIAARSLMNRPESLSRLRGRLHSYQGQEKALTPLVATYHPTFLLKNEGMKKATWADLQLAAKQLDRISGS